MTSSLERRTERGRTAKEAIVQADARFRIFSAISVRMFGLGLIGLGIVFLTRPSSWSAWRGAVKVAIGIVPPFIVSLKVLIGVGALLVGVIVILVGQWQFRRAVRAARENPIAAPLFDRLMPPDEE